jgi:hypothetical protein
MTGHKNNIMMSLVFVGCLALCGLLESVRVTIFFSLYVEKRGLPFPKKSLILVPT